MLCEVDFFKKKFTQNFVNANKNWSMQTLSTLYTYSYPDIMNLEPKISDAPSEGADLVFWLDNFPHRLLLVLLQQWCTIAVMSQ